MIRDELEHALALAIGPVHQDVGALGIEVGCGDNSCVWGRPGGMATNGHQRIMDLGPTKLHERVSVILGSKNEVQRVTEYHLEFAQTPSQE